MSNNIEKDTVILNYRDRKISFNKNDYKSTKQEKFLFDYLSKKCQYGSWLDFINKDKESGDLLDITLSDIELFCQDKKLQAKGITPDDVIKFLTKYKDLNPTKLEQEYNNLYNSFKDENGESIVKQEFAEVFGFEQNYKNPISIIDTDNNIKQGFEIFDLNDDGKIDKIEKRFLNNKNITIYPNINDLKEYLTTLDKEGSEDNISIDGIITKEDKQKIYNNLVETYNNEQHDLLNNSAIQNDNKQLIVTETIKNLYKDKMEISFEEIIDNNGKLKPGMEIFDLSGDGNLDEKEKIYWSNGGHIGKNDKASIKIESFLSAINELDYSAYDSRYGSNQKDLVITTQDKKRMYKLIESAYFMLDNIKGLPNDLQQEYIDALGKVSIGDWKKKSSIGVSVQNRISINTDESKPPEAASIMIHELTHNIIGEDLPLLLQEIVTFYMEYRLYNSAKNTPGYDQIINPRETGTRAVIVNQRYMDFCDNYKKEHPNATEIEIATEAFLRFNFEGYNGRYQKKVTPDYIRNFDLSPVKRFFE